MSDKKDISDETSTKIINELLSPQENAANIEKQNVSSA